MSENTKQYIDSEEELPGPDPVPRIPYALEIENLEMLVPEGETVAPGWKTWVADDNNFGRVEFASIEFEGERRQGFLGDGRYDAGVWQQARVEASGLSVNITMDFLVMSHDAERERPPGLVVGLGIDPLGGTDGRSDTVQWALTDLPYDKVVTASVTAVAQSDIVTIFVRSTAFLPGSHTIVGNGNKQVCANRLCAREDYDRVYILLPPNAGLNMWQQAAAVASDPSTQWTIGGSADDAGLAGTLLGHSLSHRKPVAVCVNPIAGLNQQWYDTHYPGTKFVAAQSGELNNVAGFIQFVRNNL